jgi:hypothetical protein
LLAALTASLAWAVFCVTNYAGTPLIVFVAT